MELDDILKNTGKFPSDWEPDGAVTEEVAKLWDEDRDRREKVMDGKIKDGIFPIVSATEADTDLIWVAQRAAWLGYCIGKGWIKEGGD